MLAMPAPPPLPYSLLLSLAFALALVVGLLLRFWLASRQLRHVLNHRNEVPAAFASHVSLSAHQKAADYTVAKTQLGMMHMAFSMAILLGWTLLGGLDALNAFWLEHLDPGLVQQLVLVGSFAAIAGLIDLPFGLYQTFQIDQRFGFNQMSWRLWLMDALKSTALGVCIGLPLLAAVLCVMEAAGTYWWLWAWVLWVGFNVLLLWAFPRFIAPLFNRFEPLQDDALRTRVDALMQRCGFASQGLFVMDGSRRSAHANAYFTGLGNAKRVVFYDTLLRRLTPTQVEAVLAHELGHFKHRHITRRMVSMFALSLLGFALLGWLCNQMWFYMGLGVQPMLPQWGAATPNNALALLLFMLAVPVFSFFITPWFNALSRRDEWQADAFAVAHADGGSLAQALLTLHEDNASTLTPDPWYVRFYYSHPPALERLARLPAPA